MAIINRTVDASQQKEDATVNLGAVPTGLTRTVWIAPYPCRLETLKYAAVGLSGAPIHSLFKLRGITSEALGISGIVVQAVGTSGTQGFSGLAAVGSTLLDFAAGDALVLSPSVANTNVVDMCIEIAVKKLQDVVSYNGVIG